MCAGKGADPKSPVGTAFSFSRPKRQATAIANISRVLQFASKRFVNSFLNLWVSHAPLEMLDS